MNLDRLIVRRAEIKAMHVSIEETKGSGSYYRFSPNSPESRKEMRLSERPVLFVDDDEAYFVGDCASQVAGKLAEFISRFASQAAADDMSQPLRDTVRDAKTGRTSGEGERACLTFFRSRLNSVLSALKRVGVLVAMTTIYE